MNQTPTHEELIQRIQSLENEGAELRRRVRNLAESNNKYRAFFDNSLDGMFITKPDGSVLEANRAACKMFGYSKEELLRLGREAVIDRGDPRLAAAMQQRAQNGYFAGELNFKRKDGTIVPVEITSVVFHTKAGEERSSIIVRDITARIKAEEERESLQGQLLQAQKLESVGRLAGGVAHDYNNMLSVIAGYTELALDRVAPDSELHADLKEVQAAAKRSIDITRQLLAFARKQTIDPQVVDLNELVESMLRMLRRLIGEDVELVWYPGKQLWSVKIDPAQVDQILANLCVNARDAIDGVGKVTIETGNAVCDDAWCNANAGSRTGEFVVLTVSDDGCGMDKETLGRIFEPFFTTKGLNEGTGLGLATIYGIVQQNNGFIDVHSTPGQGASFKIHLPRHAADPASAEKETKAQPPVGRGESVLVVEDEPAIMKMTQVLLQRLGYQVLAVGSPSHALQLVKTHTDGIDLLVTDVVMPEMNGRDLAHQLYALYPNLKILYMSGYTADVIARRGVLEKGMHFIQKPFSLNELGVKARDALDGG